MNSNLFHGLEGTKIYFKHLSIDDAAQIHSFASNVDVARFIGWKLMKSLDETRKHVENMIGQEKAKTHLYATVVLRSTCKIIGTVMIFNFDHSANHAEIGYVFHQNYWGCGYATEAVAMMCNFSFNVLNLHKLHARVADANFASIRVLEKNGFELEGMLKDYYFIDDTYYSNLIFGKIQPNV